jgi:two-component sensor histidine kinase
MQTGRTARTKAEFNESLESRIGSLARAHDLLTRESWEGASLADVVARARALVPSSDSGSDRIMSSGPHVRLAPNAAVTLNMAFHELVTNAAKYGSLLVPAGRVDVSWSVDRSIAPPALTVLWSESGGPPVFSRSRRGFGSRLIEQGVAREFGGTVEMIFDPDGMRCYMHLPSSGKWTFSDDVS